MFTLSFFFTSFDTYIDLLKNKNFFSLCVTVIVFLPCANHAFFVSITKSLNNLSAQIIDYFQRKTLVSVSSNEEEIRKKKVKKMEKSTLTGEILAKRAKEKNISKVFFDRGSYKYHGRIKTFADTLRKNGMKF